MAPPLKKLLKEYEAPLNDLEDRSAILALGKGNRKKAVKAISKWTAEGLLLVELAKRHNITPQALKDFWIENTTPEFRAETDKLQAEAFWLKGVAVIEGSSDDGKSTAQSRQRAKMKADMYFNTARQLDPQRWHPSASTRKAKNKEVDDTPDNAIAYGIDADYGGEAKASHVVELRGGVRADFRPKYDDVYAEKNEVNTGYLTSRIISTRPNPFDTINFRKLRRTNVTENKSKEAI